MQIKTFALVAAVLCGIAFEMPAVAADTAASSTDPTKPMTTPRIGGSPAEAIFRDAQQKAANEYHGATAICRAKPRAERGSCMSTARATLKQAQSDAKAALVAARKKAH